MKVKILLASLLAMVINLSASAMEIDLKLHNVTVKEAIAALNKMENWSIIVNSDEIDLSRKVSVDAAGASINDVLDQIFTGQSVTYVINGSRVSITAKQDAPKEGAPEKNHTIKGKVLDSSGEPLPAASLMVKGTKTGFFTDVDGNFELSGISYPATLVVSYIGFSDKEVAVAGTESSLVITLSDVQNLLDDVVVVGYGTQKRVNLTGAVSVIEGKDLNNRPVTNTAMALQGADPSLLLTTGNGSIAGNKYDVSIRGSVSLNSGSPLILIDGVDGNLSQVNPNDIESISVLKDASACAIYGAKASAGVVLITTKSGADGKAKVSYNGRFSISDNTTSTDYITSGYDYVTLTNEFYNYTKGYGAWTYTDSQLEMMKERRNDKSENPARPWVIPDETGTYTYLYLGNFDWYGYLLNRTRPETEHNVTVRGGNDKITYYASGRYLYREGLFAGSAKDKYNGYSFRSKMDVKMTKWLNYSNNISFERTDYSYGGFWEIDGSDNLASNGILYDLMRNVGPNIVPYNPDGTINIQSGYMADATSPLFSGRGGVFMDGRNHNKVVNNYLTLTNRFTANIAKGLQFIADYTYRRRDQTKEYRSLPSANCYDNANKRMYQGNGLTGGYFTNGSVYDFYQENRYYQDGHVINAFFKYSGTFGNDHNLSATAGGNFDDYRSSSLVNKQKGSLSEALGYINMANGEIIKASESNSAYRTLGFFGRVNYDWKGRYLLELSGRFDGSSRFPANHRWGFFPSASAGWRISEEPFWKSLKNAVNNAKVRLSYGTLGNQQVSNYYYWDTISTGLLNYTFDGSTKAGYAQASAPVSSDLTWETVVSKNLGVDLGFLKGRLNLTADFYIRDTKNMLTKAKTLPYVYGEEAPKENAADLRTKGYEISLGWKDTFKLASKPFSYGITATLGDYQTHITKFENESMLLSEHYVGQRLGDIWGYVSDGLFATDEEAAAYEAAIDSKGTVHKGVFACKAPYNHLMAGDIRFKDLDGNGKIDSGKNTLDKPGDRRVIGNKLPRYNYSFKGDFNWMGIDLSFFFQGVGKINWMPSSGCLYFYGPYAFERPSFITKDFNSLCWSSEEGADNSKVVFPRKRGNLVKGTTLVNSDYFLQNAAYLRLKNLTLGYTLPIKAKAIERARVYFSGENLFYISPLRKACKTIDPEVATTSATNDSMYPYSRTFSIGVDITF